MNRVQILSVTLMQYDAPLARESVSSEPQMQLLHVWERETNGGQKGHKAYECRSEGTVTKAKAKVKPGAKTFHKRAGALDDDEVSDDDDASLGGGCWYFGHW